MSDKERIFDIYFLSDSVPNYREIENKLELAKGTVTDKLISEIRNERIEDVEKITRIRELWANKRDFGSFREFNKWYSDGKVCYYCEIPQSIISDLVNRGKLTSARFPINGVITPGRTRGLYLEVDRKDSKKGYERENCVLCCYFCNNDKSDIFNADEYNKFFQNRSEYLKNLSNN